MATSTRLAGHAMRFEGNALYDEHGKSTLNRSRRWFIVNWTSRGQTECECGERSPVLTSNGQRKAWHREHKELVKVEMERKGVVGLVSRQRIYFSEAFTITFPQGKCGTTDSAPLLDSHVLGICNGDWIEVEDGRIVGAGTDA